MFEALRLGALGVLLNVEPPPKYTSNLILTETEQVWHDVMQLKECEELKWMIAGTVMQISNLDAINTFRENESTIATLEEGTRVGIMLYRQKHCTP